MSEAKSGFFRGGRARTIKPELCTHEGLFDLERELQMPVRFAWVGLILQCDKEGRFWWRPRQLKVYILPYDDCDFTQLLEALRAHGYVKKYIVNGEVYGYIPTFKQHQFINAREQESVIPAPNDNAERAADTQGTLPLATSTRAPRVPDASTTQDPRASYDIPYSPQRSDREQNSTKSKAGAHAPAVTVQDAAEIWKTCQVELKSRLGHLTYDQNFRDTWGDCIRDGVLYVVYADSAEADPNVLYRCSKDISQILAKMGYANIKPQFTRDGMKPQGAKAAR